MTIELPGKQREPFVWAPVALPVVTRVEEPGRPRLYRTPEGKEYISVSGFLSLTKDMKWIEEWKARKGEVEANRIKEEAGQRGTRLHTCLETYLKNDPSWKGLVRTSPLFRQVKHVIDTCLTEIHSLEAMVYSDKFEIGGTLDCLGKWKGVPSLMDWKSSTQIKTADRIEDYFLQATLYSIMVQELTGLVYEQIVIVIATEKDTKPTVFVRQRSEFTGKLFAMVRTYLSNVSKIKKPEEKAVSLSQFFS